MYTASENGYNNCVQLLLEFHANPDIADEVTYTLHHT